MRRNILHVAIALCGATSCVSSSEDTRGWKVTEPETYETPGPVDCRDTCVLPKGTLDFVPPDIPVMLHMAADVAPLQHSRREEIQRLRDPYYVGAVGWLDRHRDSAPFVDTIREESEDTFIGLGEPFIDDHLHLFQCRTHSVGGPQIWKFDAFYLQCEWDGQISVYFPTRSIPSDPTQPLISEKFRRWIEEIPVGTRDDDVRLTIFTYVRDQGFGFSQEYLIGASTNYPDQFGITIPPESRVRSQTD